MKVLVEQAVLPNIWHFSQTPECRIYALQDFVSDEGITVLRGTPGTDEPHLKVDCDLSGASLTIDSYEIDSTFQLGLDAPPARYTAILQTSQRKIPFLSNFIVPPEPSDTTWNNLKLFQRLGRMRYVNPPLAELQMLVAGMIADALTFLRYGSETRAGMVALTEDGLDPLFPVAVSANDPRWLSILAGTGLAVASGQATMVNGVATVSDANATTTKVIIPVSMDVGVTGQLSVPQSSIVNGVSFQIVSTNAFGDNGVVGWVMF